MTTATHKSTVVLFLAAAVASFAAEDPAELNNLGGQLFAAGQYRAAEAPLARAVELWSTEGSANLETALHNLAAVYRAEGRYSEALPLYQRAIELRETRAGARDLSLLSPLNGLALMHLESGKPARSKEVADRAISIARLHSDTETAEAANAFASLGSILSAQGRQAEAHAWLDRALSIRERVFGAESTAAADTFMDLALADRREHRLDAAEQVCRRALRIYEQTSDSGKRATAIRTLADLLTAHHQYNEADELLAQAKAEAERTSAPDLLERARLDACLANLRVAQGREQEAVVLYREALGVLEPALGAENPQLLSTLDSYAKALRASEDYAGAAGIDMRTMRIRVGLTLRQQSRP